MGQRTIVCIITAGIAAIIFFGVFGGCKLLVDPETKLKAAPPPDSAAQAFRQRQADYVTMQFGMFLHFNMSTFARTNCPGCYTVGGEHELGKDNNEPDSLFNPGALDCGQWARVAVSAGCKYIILVTKHHGGFCLWPTDPLFQRNPHSVKQSTWRGGQGDVVREFVDSTRAYGLKVGFYYSIWDKTNGSGLRMIKQQLTELLTKYGPISCLWFDGWKWRVGYSVVPYDTIKTLIHTLQPDCLIIENNHYHNMDSTEICEYEYPAVDPLVPTGNKNPSELTTPLRSDNLWFWHPNLQCNLKTADQIVRELTTMNGSKASYLLDLTPDTSGLIPQCQVDEMKVIGQMRK